MSSSVFINHLDYYIPDGRMAIDDFVDNISDEGIFVFQDKEELKEYLEEYLPLKYLAIEKDFSLETILISLLKKNIDEGQIIPAEIDYVIIAIERNEEIKHFGHKIQESLEINESANIIHLTGNYCANIDVAIGFAENLVRACKESRKVLILTGNKIQSLKNRLVGTYGILGDAVGLISISNERKNAQVEIIGQKTVLKGELHNGDLTKDNSILHYQAYLESFEKALSDYEINPEDLSQVFLHNANVLLTQEAVKMCDVDEGCFYDKNRFVYGHLDTVDLIMNLKDYLAEQNTSDAYLASLSIGFTGTYVTTIYKKINA